MGKLYKRINHGKAMERDLRFRVNTETFSYLADVPEIINRAAIKANADFVVDLHGRRIRMKKSLEPLWHYNWDPVDPEATTEGTFERDDGPIAHFSVHYRPTRYIEVRTMNPDGPTVVTDSDRQFVSELVKAINDAAEEVFRETA